LIEGDKKGTANIAKL